MAVSYLLQENGDKLYLEDVSGFLVLDESIPGPTVDYQGDGKGRRKKRRNRTYELFEQLEATIRATLADDPVPAQAVAPEAPSLDLSCGFDAALDQLFQVAGEYQDLSARVEALRREIQAYEAKRWQELLDDDEEFWLLA